MLRRLISLLLSLFVLLSLGACLKKKGSEQPVTTGFKCDMDVQYGDMNVKGQLSRSTAGTLRIDVDEPASLKGLSMEWDGDDIVLKLHGLSFGVDPDTVPQSALGKGILEALDATLGIRESGKLTDEGLSTKGTSSAGEFEIISDPDTGSLLNLKVPSANLTATFSNFEVTSEAASANATTASTVNN